MDLPNVSGRLQIMLIGATEARAIRIADQRPTNAIGMQAAK